MSDQEKSEKEEIHENNSEGKNTDIKADSTIDSAENAVDASKTENNSNWEAKANEMNDKYLRLYSEFDNYRKRTMKEKSEIIKTAGEDVFKAMLPVIDDFDRAVKANEKIEDIQSIKEGLILIHNKLKNIIQQKGLIAFECTGTPFDADTMEAITHIPAADDSQKGMVVDEVEKGYKLGDKVIRFAKVIIAQ